MAQIKLTNFPTKSLAYFLVLAGGILVFIVLAILPAMERSAGLDMEIKKIKGAMDEQKILTPVYDNLLRKTKFKKTKGIEAPKKKKLAQGDTRKIIQQLNNIANSSNIKLVDVTPDVDTLIGGSGYLLLKINAQGEFINLHKFLFQLCELPFLESIEQIKINSIRTTKEFRLKVWMSQE
ncbi:MAG: hypothetical protein KJO26_14400 [Deltaproteobacteria bacterium]|nr:hypothetical protein [Deltaproteobacteria bacterium]